jgi:hypothetical protein
MDIWLAAGRDLNAAAAIVDPEGKGPRLFFEKKPKTPTTSIPIHLDLNASDREAGVQRLVGLGAPRWRPRRERPAAIPRR